MAKKYYWLRLQKDFFKRHDIKIIENMTNGKDYILFYLKLLVESVSHDGELRFSETIPYNIEMLSTITDTNVDIVKSAMSTFVQLHMVEILEDETIYMAEIEKMIGYCSEIDEKARENHRLRQKRYRERLKMNENNICVSESIASRDDNVTVTRDVNINTNINTNINNNNSALKRFVIPTIDEVQAYINEKGYDVNAGTFVDFYESKGWLIGKNKMKDWKAAVRTWDRKNRETSANRKTASNDKIHNFSERNTDFDAIAAAIMT